MFTDARLCISGVMVLELDLYTDVLHRIQLPITTRRTSG
jgi:hypothetical protein